MFLIFKPVFEHWTGGEASPTNRTERQKDWLIHPSNIWQSYWRALQQGCLVMMQHSNRQGCADWPLIKTISKECLDSGQPPPKIEVDSRQLQPLSLEMSSAEMTNKKWIPGAVCQKSGPIDTPFGGGSRNRAAEPFCWFFWSLIKAWN